MNRDYAQACLARGYCYHCGGRKVAEGKTKCRVCLDKGNDRQARKRQAAGLFRRSCGICGGRDHIRPRCQKRKAASS